MLTSGYGMANTHITAAVVTSTRLSQAKFQYEQGRGLQGLNPSRRVMGSWWLLSWVEYFSFGDVATGKLFMPQWMVTYPRAYG